MLRLLIADDEQIIREALSEMIDYASLGYELIGAAKNGMEAYDIICDEYPDVVITDIRMPILNGLELIKKAQKTDDHIRFVLLSGYGEFEYAQKAMRFGVQHYLLKPTRRQELIDTLMQIQAEILQQKNAQQKEQQVLLHNLRPLLQQCFFMEALGQTQNFSTLFRKYEQLLVFPAHCNTACFFYFIEESYLEHFAQDIRRLLAEADVSCDFPLIYVKHTLIVLAPIETLAAQESIKERFKRLSYPEQSTSFDLDIAIHNTQENLFSDILRKISRYERILLLSEKGTYELSNALTAPTNLTQLAAILQQPEQNETNLSLLQMIFPDNQDLQNAKNLAVSLFLQTHPEDNHNLEFACDFFRKLYSCTEVSTIRNLLQRALLQEGNKPNPKLDSVSLLKQYVEQHLSSESLSLKWLAENYLFVNVGHLSKQFVKKEGIRFSEYLNQKRMDEAVRLMHYYKNDNIKDIATQCGFRNNPQYFSQVFKKYTGYTPSDYIDALNHEEMSPISPIL